MTQSFCLLKGSQTRAWSLMQVDMGVSTVVDAGVNSGSPETDMGGLDLGAPPRRSDGGCSAVGATPWWGLAIIGLFLRRRNRCIDTLWE